MFVTEKTHCRLTKLFSGKTKKDKPYTLAQFTEVNNFDRLTGFVPPNKGFDSLKEGVDYNVQFALKEEGKSTFTNLMYAVEVSK